MKKLKNLKIVSIIGIVCISLLIYLLYPVINQEIKKYQTKETFTNLAKDWLNEAKSIEIKKDYRQSMSSMDFTNQLLKEVYSSKEFVDLDQFQNLKNNANIFTECEKDRNKICIKTIPEQNSVNIYSGLFSIEMSVNNNSTFMVAYDGPFSEKNSLSNFPFRINGYMYPNKNELSVEELAAALATYYSEDEGTSELNYIKNKGVYLDKYGNNKYEQEKNDFIVGYVFKHLKIKK